MVSGRCALGSVSVFAVALALTSVTARGIGKDAGYVGAYVNVNYLQTGPGTPILAPGTPFDFNITVSETSDTPNSITSASVTGPGGFSTPLTYEGDRYWSYSEHYANKSAMETARAGTLVVATHGVTDGDATVNAGITDGTVFADAPHIANFTALQTVDPLQAMTIATDPLTISGGLTDPQGFVGISITDSLGNVVYEADLDDNVFPPILLPANTLSPGQLYNAKLISYFNFAGGRTSDFYPSGAYWNATTAFTIQTVPEPASLTILGLAAAAMLRKPRRN